MRQGPIWTLALLPLLVIGSGGSRAYAQDETTAAPGLSEAQRAAFAQVRVLKLVLKEHYYEEALLPVGDWPSPGVPAETEGQSTWVGALRAITDLLEATGFEVVTDGEADAQLVVTVRGMPRSAMYVPWELALRRDAGEAAVRRYAGGEASAEAALAMPGFPPLRAFSSERRAPPDRLEGIAYIAVQTSPAWDLARTCARVCVLRLLVQLDPPRVFPLVKHEAWEDWGGVAWCAVTALGQIGERGVRPLVQALEHPGPAVRQAAAEALGSIGAEAKAAVPALMKALKDEDASVYIAAGEALGSIGEASVPGLIKALKDERWFVRSTAAEALAQIGPDAEAAVPALVEALRDEDSQVRSTAAEALGQIGPEAKAAVLPLVEAVKDEHWLVGLAAAEVLAQIGPEAKAAVPALTEALEDPAVRSAAAVALAGIAPGTPGTIPALVEALRADLDYLTTAAAARALGRIGPQAEAAVPALTDALKGASSMVLRAVVEAVQQIQPDEAAALVPALIQALKYWDCQLRVCAAELLGSLGGGPTDVVPALVDALQDVPYYGPDRVAAAKALGQIGPAAQAAVPALVKALNDGRPELQQAAAAALKRIRGEE